MTTLGADASVTTGSMARTTTPLPRGAQGFPSSQTRLHWHAKHRADRLLARRLRLHCSISSQVGCRTPCPEAHRPAWSAAHQRLALSAKSRRAVRARRSQRDVVVQVDAPIAVCRQNERISWLAGQGDAARPVSAFGVEVAQRQFGAIAIAQMEGVAVPGNDDVAEQVIQPRAVLGGCDQAVMLARLGVDSIRTGRPARGGRPCQFAGARNRPRVSSCVGVPVGGLWRDYRSFKAPPKVLKIGLARTGKTVRRAVRNVHGGRHSGLERHFGQFRVDHLASIGTALNHPDMRTVIACRRAVCQFARSACQS